MLLDVIVIGGGQTGLALGYYLRRSGLDYLILDNQSSSGGAWLHSWNSLTLFSPAEYSSLPGWLMPRSEGVFPTKHEVLDYLRKYEQKYELPVERNVEVSNVKKSDDIYTVFTNNGTYQSRSLIAATGRWMRPFIPQIDGLDEFMGSQIHSAFYRNPFLFSGQKTLIVGEGNSGAQILAEVSKVTNAKWATRKEPEFLPDDIDGRVLFNEASARYYAMQKGETFNASKYGLGTIVMVPSVKEARDRKVLVSSGRIRNFYPTGVVWESGINEEIDAVIWCTGFGYATNYLSEIVTVSPQGKVETEGTKARETDGLWLVGFGNWTGFASATLIGVGRTARETVGQAQDYLGRK